MYSPSEDQVQWLFDDLPSELLLKIFSYFSHYQLCRNIAPVCRKWRDYAYDPIHWQKVQLHLTSIVEPKVLQNLFERTRLLKHLVITASRNMQFSVEDLEFFSCNMHHLTELHLKFIESLNVASLKCVLQRVPFLQYLGVEGCVLMDDDCIEEICHLDCLNALNISHCRRITDVGIMRLANNIKYLTLLNIDGVIPISQRSLECLVDYHCKNFHQLYLDGEEMSDLRSISSCSDLQTLSISYADDLNDSFLTNIMKLSKLEVLRICRGKALTVSAIKNLFVNGTMKNLTHLDLSECASLDDSVVSILCSRYGQFLEELVLSWCWKITDIGLEAIVNSCRVLRHLNLCGLSLITGKSFQKIPDLMPCLRLLDLTQCNKIEDNIISNVVSGMAVLTAIDYYGELYQAGISVTIIEKEAEVSV